MDTALLLLAHRTAWQSRHLERFLFRHWRKGLLRPLFSGYGAEVAPSIITALLKKSDYVVPRYRGYAAVIGKGMQPERLVAELAGRAGGVARGVGDIGFHEPAIGIPGSSINLGAMFAVSIGLGLSVRHRGDAGVVAQFFGDGEASRTTLPSALNAAALWKLPVLFICENNRVSDKARLSDMSATTSLTKLAEGVGVRSATVSDTDAMTLAAVAEERLAHVRVAHEPFFLEVTEQRFAAHSSANEAFDSVPAIPETEDPLILFEHQLVRGGVRQEDLERAVQETEKEIVDAIDAAFAQRRLTEAEFRTLFYE